jgi:dTDP-4-amino-4,6-dideoxygalactose transaminase
MSKRIFLSPPHMGGDELNLIHEAFDSNWVSPAGPHLAAFESELSQRLKGLPVVALSSGTAAVHLALLLIGVKPGDEVLCSSFTFAGSCNPIVYLGAEPVFVDSEKETWNIDPGLLRHAIQDRISKTGRKPKALIVVHLYGMPAKMKEITEVAREFEVPIIEDAAEALGSTYCGEPCGAMGDFGVLSFNGNKIITTSGGGALVCSNDVLAEKARYLATQAREPFPYYEHTEIGYNYRLSNICAAIGRGQLRVLDDRVAARRRNFETYAGFLAGKPLEMAPAEHADAFSNRWLTTILLHESVRLDPNGVRLLFEQSNIETRLLWKPMHLQPVFRNSTAYVNGVSEQLFRSGLCLPSGSALKGEDFELIFSNFKQIFSQF